MKRPSTAMRFLTPKKLKYALLFNEDEKVLQFFISWRLKCYCRFIKLQIIFKFLKYCQNDTKMAWKAWKCYMTIFEGQRTRPVLNLTIYDDRTFSSCHIQYTNNILDPVSSYYFQSYKRLFQASNSNGNIRPNLLYFRTWGIHSKRYRR